MVKMWGSSAHGEKLKRSGEGKWQDNSFKWDKLRYSGTSKIIGNKLLDQFSFATTYVLFPHPHILRVWVENKDILVLNTDERPLSSSNMLYSPLLPQCLYSGKQYETATYMCKAWERLFYAKYLLGKILPSTYYICLHMGSYTSLFYKFIIYGESPT